MGSFAAGRFGVVVLGASLLAAASVPLATAYSITEGLVAPASLDLDSKHFQLFYAAFVGLTVAAASVISIPGLPLIPLIYTSQVVNAVMLPLHVIDLVLLASDPTIMGDANSGRLSIFAAWLSIALIMVCVGALIVSWIVS